VRVQSVLFVVAVAFAGHAVHAQSRPGLTFDLHTRTGRQGDTTTNVIHMKGTPDALRMEFDKRPAGGQYRNLPVGDHGVVIIRASGAELIMLDPDKKQYMSIKPLEMMSGARQMMESMGGSMTLDTAGSSIQVDSLGPGPTIDGHNTLRYRLTAKTRIRIAMMGQEQTVESQVISVSDNAVDLGDFSSMLGPGAGLRDMLQSMMQTVGLPKDFMDRASKAGQRVKGFPLHTERQTTATTPNGTRTSSETSDTKNVRRASIPDSEFTVPGDYKLMPFPLGQPRPAPDRN
jgi:hypothetical protein